MTVNGVVSQFQRVAEALGWFDKLTMSGRGRGYAPERGLSQECLGALSGRVRE